MMAARASGIAKASVNACASHRATAKFAATMVAVDPAAHALLAPSVRAAANAWRLVCPSVQIKNVAPMVARGSAVNARQMVIAPLTGLVNATRNVTRLGNVGIMVVGEIAVLALGRRRFAIRASMNV